MVFTKAYELARRIVAPFLEEGSLAVDATAGNGKDTLFLAQRVGSSGHVYAFDVQPQALEKTEALLAQAGLRQRVTLFEAGHEHLAAYIHRQIKVVMFNLGYLPGGDHAIITRPETTRAALESALELLEKGGIISVVAYTGHPGSLKEKEVLEELCRALDQRAFTVTHHAFINQAGCPPELFTIQKH